MYVSQTNGETWIMCDPTSHNHKIVMDEATNLRLLHDWLRGGTNNENILVPTSVVWTWTQTKTFKDNARTWTWEEYDKRIEIEKQKREWEWGIILTDICVIDVNSPAVAALLEARFPELLLAPCAETQHGFHYYFRRSKLADDSKYCHGEYQRLDTVGFRSIQHTGAGGFVRVPPSAEVKWIHKRAPWETDMITIPDALLSTVARPYGMNDEDQHGIIDVLCGCCDVLCGCWTQIHILCVRLSLCQCRRKKKQKNKKSK